MPLVLVSLAGSVIAIWKVNESWNQARACPPHVNSNYWYLLERTASCAVNQWGTEDYKIVWTPEIFIEWIQKGPAFVTVTFIAWNFLWNKNEIIETHSLKVDCCWVCFHEEPIIVHDVIDPLHDYHIVWVLIRDDRWRMYRMAATGG